MTTELMIDEEKYQLTNIPELSVKGQIDYERVISFRNIAVERKKLIEETFNPMKQKAHSAWKEIVSTMDKFLNPVQGVIDTIDSNVRGFKREQERKAQEEQDRLRRIAEEKARKEREALEARAKKAIASGKEEKAEALLEKAEQVEALVPTVAPLFSKVKGDTTRKNWRAEVTDFNLLPKEYTLPDMQTLNALARTKKGTIAIPGVKWICE